MGKKILNIALFLIISLVVYCLLSGGFGYLYYRTQSVSYDVNLSETNVPEWLNYSLAALLPQNVRGMTATGMQGRILLTVELTVRLLMLAVFIGLFVTFISRYRDSMFPTRFIYVRHVGDRYFLSLRIGNRGGAVLNAKASLELLYWKDNVRRMITTEAKENAFFEKLISFDVDLSQRENVRLLTQLKTAVFMRSMVSLRFVLTGIDAKSGHPVSISRSYSNRDIKFGSRFVDLFVWKNGRRSKVRWRNLDAINPTGEDDQRQFKLYKESTSAGKKK